MFKDFSALSLIGHIFLLLAWIKYNAVFFSDKSIQCLDCSSNFPGQLHVNKSVLEHWWPKARQRELKRTRTLGGSCRQNHQPQWWRAASQPLCYHESVAALPQAWQHTSVQPAWILSGTPSEWRCSPRWTGSGWDPGAPFQHLQHLHHLCEKIRAQSTFTKASVGRKLTQVLLQKQPTKLKKAWHYNSWQTAVQLLIALMPLTHYSLWRGEVQYSNVMQQASMFNVWVISQGSSAGSTHADNSLSWFDVGLFGVCRVLTLPLHWSADKSWQTLGGSTIIYLELI